MRQFLLVLFGWLLINSTWAQSSDSNPPAEGFRASASDARAVALADSVMVAMGGRAAWDNTRYLHWNFFGRRTLLWDKQEKRVRIEIPGQDAIYLLDLNTMEGRVQQDGKEYTQPDSLKKYLERAHAIWINDSYWLVQPFKLKDSGVALQYIGSSESPEGVPSEVIDMTFEAVGLTPQNRYRLYLNADNYRVNYWEFFRDAADEQPAMATPYRGYDRYGSILLSGDRGKYRLSDIEVLEEVPDRAFTDLGQWR